MSNVSGYIFPKNVLPPPPTPSIDFFNLLGTSEYKLIQSPFIDFFNLLGALEYKLIQSGHPEKMQAQIFNEIKRNRLNLFK